MLAQAERASTPDARRGLLQQALLLWRGEPLADFDCAARNHWAEAWRYPLQAAYDRTRAELAALAEPAPRHAPISVLPNRRERFLQRLSVFPGSFSPEAAERVCHQPIALLAELAQAGQVRAEGTRLCLTPDLRPHLWASLRNPERDQLSSEHARWISEVAQTAWRDQSPQSETALWTERPSVTAALRWCLDARKEIPTGISLAGHLSRAWVYWGALDEGLAWLEKAISLSEAVDWNIAWGLYYGASHLCLGLHRPEQSAHYLKEALEEASGKRDEAYLGAWALHARGLAAYHRGEWNAAEQDYVTALQAFADQPLGVSSVLADQGDLRLHRGDLPGARALYERSLEIACVAGRALTVAEARYRLGSVLLQQGSPEEARTHLDASLAIRQREGDSVGIGDCLEMLGRIEAERGGYGLAVFLLGRCLAQFAAPDKWPSRARALGTLGDVLAKKGDRAEAERTYRDGLALWRDSPGQERWVASFERRLAALEQRPADGFVDAP